MADSQEPEETPRPAAAPPLTLQQLSDAFSEMLGEADLPPTAPLERVEDAATAAEPGAAGRSAVENYPVTPLRVLEAMLFVGHPGNEPLRPERAAELIRGVEPAEVEALIGQLHAEYAAEGAPYTILSEGGGYRLVLADEHQPARRRYFGRVREARLSQAAVEVLALVAYNQPLSSQQISELRGHPSGHVLSLLVRRRLLRVERRPERPRTPLYLTTPRFLKLFGLTSLEELPQAQELEK